MSDTDEVRGSGGEGGGSDDAGAENGGGLLTRERLERYQERLVDTAILGLPIAAINWGLGRISGPLTSQPWHILWFVAPLALVAWIVWRRVMKRGSFRVRGAMLLFLICFLSAFTLASAADLLVWARSTVTFDEGRAPRNWLLPAWWGDWRYLLARRPPPVDGLVVVTMDAPADGATRNQVRLELARLIQFAARNGARGIAFDIYFGQEPSDIDAFLCGVVNGSGIPVIAGRRVVKGETGRLFAEPYAESIEPCFPDERRAHLLAYRDADGAIRNVVLHINGIPDSTSLAQRVADQLSADPHAAQTPMQFLEPRDGFPPLEYEQLADLPAAELRGVLDGRFLLVGERSAAETFHTPFGDRLGVEVHAAAIASLLAGDWIERSPWWSGFLIIVVACYLIVALAADGASTRKLLIVVLAISGFLIAAAAAAMRVWQVWLDLIYPLAAVWLLLGLLLLLRKKLGASPGTA